MPLTYPLAEPGIFSTIQGEGALLGLPMIFVRLGGCSIGCRGCDTDYKVASRASAAQIAEQAARLHYGGLEWACLTGGEPTDHDLAPLIDALHGRGLRVALATAGTRKVQRGACQGGVDFLSVSPHDPGAWVQRTGDQLNLVPGLNGFDLADFGPSLDMAPRHFGHCYVTPRADREGRLVNLPECLLWVRSHQGWRLGVQAHKQWGLP